MYDRIRPLLFRIDAERAHNLGMLAARLGQRVAGRRLAREFAVDDARLRVEAFGRTFDNPIGIAAGFDKNARLVPLWHQLGCGFAEVGSVSARRSKGNRRPRAFRLPQDEALINRMGLNNQGAARIARRLRERNHPLPLAISLVKTHDPAIAGEAAIHDFADSFRQLAPLGDLVVLNLSCPNTAEGKTFEDPNVLDDLLSALMPLRKEVAPNIPVLLKLSPPVTSNLKLDSEVDEIVAVGSAHGVSGFIASNTASDRAGLTSDDALIERIGRGGVSGRPLADRSRALVRYLYRRTEGRVPIVGVGGVFDGEDAYRMMRAGASLVQLYTALVYRGPSVFARIKQELAERLASDGLSSVRQAIGADAD